MNFLLFSAMRGGDFRSSWFAGADMGQIICEQSYTRRPWGSGLKMLRMERGNVGVRLCSELCGSDQSQQTEVSHLHPCSHLDRNCIAAPPITA